MKISIRSLCPCRYPAYTQIKSSFDVGVFLGCSSPTGISIRDGFGAVSLFSRMKLWCCLPVCLFTQEHTWGASWAKKLLAVEPTETSDFFGSASTSKTVGTWPSGVFSPHCVALKQLNYLSGNCCLSILVQACKEHQACFWRGRGAITHPAAMAAAFFGTSAWPREAAHNSRRLHVAFETLHGSNSPSLIR